MSVSRIPVKFVVVDVGEAEGELIRHLAPRTVDAILRNLPIEGVASTWMEEVYFKAGLNMGAEKPKTRVNKGDVAYWPMGDAICIFYGESQPAGPVNVVGRVTKGLELFRAVEAGSVIRLEKP